MLGQTILDPDYKPNKQCRQALHPFTSPSEQSPHLTSKQKMLFNTFHRETTMH